MAAHEKDILDIHPGTSKHILSIITHLRRLYTGKKAPQAPQEVKIQQEEEEVMVPEEEEEHHLCDPFLPLWAKAEDTRPSIAETFYDDGSRTFSRTICPDLVAYQSVVQDILSNYSSQPMEPMQCLEDWTVDDMGFDP